MQGRRFSPPHPGGLRVLTLCLVLAVSACAPLSSLIPGGSPRGELRVRVLEKREGGANLPTPTPAPVPPPTPTLSPFRGQATVRVALAGNSASVIAEGVASDSSWTSFSVPAGRYWVFLPHDHQTTLADPAVGSVNLPDGTVANAWAEVTVPAGGTVDVALVYAYMYS